MQGFRSATHRTSSIFVRQKRRQRSQRKSLRQPISTVLYFPQVRKSAGSVHASGFAMQCGAVSCVELRNTYAIMETVH